MAENVVYLGRHGCYTTKEGLRVAYLSGAVEGSQQAGISYEQVKSLEVQLKWNDSGYQGVDILLTSQWPKGTQGVWKDSRGMVEGNNCEKYLISRKFLVLNRLEFSAILK